ncbi:hypothetical protein PEC18_18080 [Paucibacter sp. O1-1]|nr:hypothetical protein [Paucibacter sp. O1-1]MDA3827709.1 hypothetical protein [Paucibacter sp. O1-1]
MDVVARIKQVLESEPNEAQLDKYLSDVRDSLATSSKLFTGYTLLILTTLVTYHLVAYAGATGFTLNSLQLADPSLFKRVFLVIPAGLLVAKASVGYLRRCQREVYDYLTLSRYRVLGQSGLHELRLPADYILGLYFLKNEGGVLGKFLASITAFLSFCVSVLLPVAYIVCAAYLNARAFGTADAICLVASIAASAMSICALLIVWLAMRVKA